MSRSNDIVIINTEKEIGGGIAVDLHHMGMGWKRSRKEVKEYIKDKQRVSKNSLNEDRTRAAVAKEAALKSKIRAASYVNGKSDFRKLFEVYDKDGSGELDIHEFLRAMRRDGRISKRNFSDSELKEIFAAIDIDKNGVIDADEFLIWFGVGKSTRNRLPSLGKNLKRPTLSQSQKGRNFKKQSANRNSFIVKNKKKGSKGGGTVDLEALAARQAQARSSGPGLTKFWYKQRADYMRKVAEGSELRVLLPYNFSAENVAKKYQDLHEDLVSDEMDRSVQSALTLLLQKCGIPVDEDKVERLVRRARLVRAADEEECFLKDANGEVNERFAPGSPEMQQFLSEVLIDSSGRGWEYEFRSVSPIPQSDGDAAALRLPSVSTTTVGDGENRRQVTSPMARERRQRPHTAFRVARSRLEEDIARGTLRDNGAWYEFARFDVYGSPPPRDSSRTERSRSATFLKNCEGRSPKHQRRRRRLGRAVPQSKRLVIH